MEKIQSYIMTDFSENISYDEDGIPLYIRRNSLSDYLNMCSQPHWHDDLEIMYITEGQLYYPINGNSILLRKGDCILVNSRQMHHSRSYHRQDSSFICILFHPQLLSGNPILFQKYVHPVLKNPAFSYLLFHPEHSFYQVMHQFVQNLTRWKEEADLGYQIKIAGSIHLFWCSLLEAFPYLTASSDSTADFTLQSQQNMIAYIHGHYMEKITLQDIAASGNICRSKCCRIFNQYLNTSPIEFLNQYRLEISCYMLIHETLSITEIAYRCGFSTASYYTQQFKKAYHCTPAQYRQAAIKGSVKIKNSGKSRAF